MLADAIREGLEARPMQRFVPVMLATVATDFRSFLSLTGWIVTGPSSCALILVS